MDYFEGQSTWPLLLGKALFLVLKLFYHLLFGSLEGPSTILWLRKALFSVLKFLFYLSFGFPDGQPTRQKMWCPPITLDVQPPLSRRLYSRATYPASPIWVYSSPALAGLGNVWVFDCGV